jgi:hypothetical protein
LTSFRGSKLGWLALVGAATLLATAPTASAESKKKKASSYWTVSFLGGVLNPYKGMKDTHKRGLAAGARIGWTGKMGVGLDLAVEYSPLPADNPPPLTTFETHYVVSTFGPKLVLGRGAFRIWAGGGGGMAVERTKTLYRDQPQNKETRTALVAQGAGGIEFHFMSSGGLTVTGNFTRTTKRGLAFTDGLKYKHYNITGGLIFTFK